MTRRMAAVLTVLAVCAGCTPNPDDPGAVSSPLPPATSTGAPSSASSSASTSVSPTPKPTSSTSTQEPEGQPAKLPRGGTKVFPRYRLVGYSGLTGAKTLGRLGTGPLDQRVREMERRAKPYEAGREILPVLEVITTIVQASPGSDGKYRVRLSDDKIRRYLKAARKHRALLLLNIQPGRSEFIIEAKAYEKWLKQPDVGVALDPEWAMDPGQVPGRAYGHSTGAELDRVSRYLSRLVRQNDLPEKVMVYHQVAASVVRRESGFKDHPGVAVVKSVDGLGHPGPKINTYRVVNQTTPKFVHPGFKLFFTEDRRNNGRLMTPKEVLRLRPRPEYVLYE